MPGRVRACMRSYMPVCVHARDACVHTCVRAYIGACLCACLHAFVHVCLSAYTLARMPAHVSTYVLDCMCTPMCTSYIIL